MKKFLFLYVLMLIFCVETFAIYPADKGAISGKIVEATSGTPIEFANVAVFNQATNQPCGGTITDARGVFKIDNLKDGTYTLKASFIGFDPLEIKDIVITGGQHKNIGVIKFASSDQQLDEVEVTAKKNHVEYKIDKKIVNVATDVNADGGSAADALEGVPSVDVDIDGNVSLRGSTNFTVLIDGKPTALDAADVLKQTPAAMIDNIEIITNPSAKYDPEGTTGIINLVTKKNVIQGVNGVVNLAIGNQGRYGGDFLFNMKKQKVNYFVGGNFNKRGFNGNGETQRVTYANDYDKHVNQSNWNENRWGGGGIKTGVDLYPNDNNSINITLEAGFFGNDRDGYNEYANWFSHKNLDDIYDQEYVRSDSKSDGNSYYGNISTSWQHNFAQKGHKLNFNGFYSRSKNDSDEDFMQYKFSTPQELSSMTNSISTTGHIVDNVRDQDRARINLDYTKPFNDDNGKFEAGYQLDLSKAITDYDFDDYNASTKGYDVNDEFTSDITFKRFINSVYSTVSRNFGKFGVQLGLRGEYTFRNITSPKELDKDLYKIDRFDVFPTLHISQQIGERNSLQFGYSKRIRRPWENALNPFPRYSDEFSRSIGNPDLQPEYTDVMELNFQANWDKMFWAFESFFNHTDGATERVSTLATDGSDILISRFENLSDNNNFGFEITGNYDPCKWFGVNVDFEIRQYYIKGVYNGVERKQDGNSWRTRETFNFTPGKNTKIQLTLRYNGKSQSLISNNKGNFDTGLAIRQSFFKKRLSCTFGMRDIFNTRRNTSTTQTDEYYLYSKRYRKAPVWNLGMSFKINNFKEKMPNGSDSGSSYESSDEMGDF